MTLEPDGEATGCNPVEVGSIPTGVSDQPTACVDYINLNLKSICTTPSLVGRKSTQLHAGTTSQVLLLVLIAPSRCTFVGYFFEIDTQKGQQAQLPVRST